MHILYLKDVIFLLIIKQALAVLLFNSSTSFFRILKFEAIHKNLQCLYF